MEKAKIIIATHKKYPMPSDEIYLPLHVGAEGKDPLPYQKDNNGDNISTKNPYYCELTGLYWAWKNLNTEFIGLAHYRRHFCGKLPFFVNEKKRHVLSSKELDKLTNRYDIILPKKRNYVIETLYSHYDHTMHIEPLNEAGKIIEEKYPAYSKEFELLKKRRSAHMFNMLIMKKELLDKYCTWLFDILEELEKRVDASKYDAFHARFFGRVSELLLDVWLRTNKLKSKEIRVVGTESTNWTKKITSFLRAKFKKEKYEKSF